MLSNNIKKIKISSRKFVICMNNTAIITINTPKTITISFISYFFKQLFCTACFLTKER